jgi:uncharacterized membrane protein
MKKFLPLAFSTLLLMSSFVHIIAPEVYAALIPDFISDRFAHIFSIALEIPIGLALFFPKTRQYGGLAFASLMMGFLPLHIWDVWRPDPAMGSTYAAWGRLILQLLMIYAGFWLYKVYQPKTSKS